MVPNARLAEPRPKQNCRIRGKMKQRRLLLIFTLCLLTLLSCGIEGSYYLPQISESSVGRVFNTAATVQVPAIDMTEHYYASNYVIFYKIYISSLDSNTIIDILNNNSRIASDYSALFPYIDPTSTSSIPSLNTFSGRGYYELELEGADIRKTILTTGGGLLNIQFKPIPGERPSVIFNATREFILYRSNGGGTFNPKPDRYFRGSSDLNDYTNAMPTINADVSAQSGTTEFAYVSMYIVAVGQNPDNFSRLYGKPTHINIFKLPPIN